MYFVSLITQKIEDPGALTCLRLLLLQKQNLSCIGGNESVIKLLREAARHSPAEALHCMTLLRSSGLDRAVNIAQEPQAIKVAA